MTAVWRKQIMPFGTISRHGREMAFTPAYLADMAAAFTGSALDIVPFAFGDARGFSNDPELIRGTVRSLEVVVDGMDAVIAVDAETDALLDAHPGITTGARIIERYRNADGREFPVVLAGVYITSAPVLTGMRPWTREPAEGVVRDG